MRKHVKENKKEKATVSLRKILAISIILFMLTGMMGVMASTNQVKNVKIVLSSGYEMNVISSSTKVSDILKENNIVILDGETVIPGVDEELTDNKTITITKDEVQKKADITYLSENEILESYKSIVEKVITVEEEIPFETVTKDVSNGGDLQDRVVQAGQNGIKEVTYRIKYQNGNEIEKTKVSEVVTKEPVDKIVEVRTKVVSRASASRAVSGNVAEYQSYAYSKCKERGWSETLMHVTEVQVLMVFHKTTIVQNMLLGIETVHILKLTGELITLLVDMVHLQVHGMHLKEKVGINTRALKLEYNIN